MWNLTSPGGGQPQFNPSANRRGCFSSHHATTDTMLTQRTPQSSARRNPIHTKTWTRCGQSMKHSTRNNQTRTPSTSATTKPNRETQQHAPRIQAPHDQKNGEQHVVEAMKLRAREWRRNAHRNAHKLWKRSQQQNTNAASAPHNKDKQCVHLRICAQKISTDTEDVHAIFVKHVTCDCRQTYQQKYALQCCIDLFGKCTCAKHTQTHTCCAKKTTQVHSQASAPHVWL